jgi:hypothetical protein
VAAGAVQLAQGLRQNLVPMAGEIPTTTPLHGVTLGVATTTLHGLQTMAVIVGATTEATAEATTEDLVDPNV